MRSLDLNQPPIEKPTYRDPMTLAFNHAFNYADKIHWLASVKFSCEIGWRSLQGQSRADDGGHDVPRDRGLTADPVVRQRLAALWSEQQIRRWTNARVRDNARAGRVVPDLGQGLLRRLVLRLHEGLQDGLLEVPEDHGVGQLGERDIGLGADHGQRAAQLVARVGDEALARLQRPGQAEHQLRRLDDEAMQQFVQQVRHLDKEARKQVELPKDEESP